MITSWAFFFLVVIGGLCSRYAKQRGRHTTGWFFIGFSLGLLGLLLLFILPKKEKALATAAAATFNIKESSIASSQPSVIKEPTYWYYLTADKKQEGPLSKEALLTAFEEKKFTEKSLVWNETLDAWTSYKDLK